MQRLRAWVGRDRGRCRNRDRGRPFAHDPRRAIRGGAWRRPGRRRLHRTDVRRRLSVFRRLGARRWSQPTDRAPHDRVRVGGGAGADVVIVDRDEAGRASIPGAARCVGEARRAGRCSSKAARDLAWSVRRRGSRGSAGGRISRPADRRRGTQPGWSPVGVRAGGRRARPRVRIGRADRPRPEGGGACSPASLRNVAASRRRGGRLVVDALRSFADSDVGASVVGRTASA